MDSTRREVPTRDVWMEVHTPEDRIEGVVRVPANSRCRRIADLVWHADRGASGILHLANVTVYDKKTSSVRFRKNSLGINKQHVIYCFPVNQQAGEPHQVWDISESTGKAPMPPLSVPLNHN